MKKRFRLTIECDNDAFAYPEQEIARILRDVAERVRDGERGYDKYRSLYDSNGDPVGTYRLKDEG